MKMMNKGSKSEKSRCLPIPGISVTRSLQTDHFVYRRHQGAIVSNRALCSILVQCRFLEENCQFGIVAMPRIKQWRWLQDGTLTKKYVSGINLEMDLISLAQYIIELNNKGEVILCLIKKRIMIGNFFIWVILNLLSWSKWRLRYNLRRAYY